MGEGISESLLRRAKGGDRAALGEIYRTHAARVFGLCRKLLGSADKAQDAASETFLRVQKAMNGYNPTLPFERWVLSIAGRLCVDRLRRRKVERSIFRDEAIEEREATASGPSPLEAMVAKEERQALRDAVDGLAERYRLALTLRYYTGLGYEEIAETLGVTRKHVAVLIHRARQEVRKALKQRMAPGESKE